MKKILAVILISFSLKVSAQSLYFPPTSGNTWDTLSPSSLGWCEDKIDTMLDWIGDQNTKAFIVLKDGKIVIEKYYGTFTKDSLWQWASAGKTLTAFIVGIAQQEGYLSIADTTSKYLGERWTSCPLPEENSITVWNQLTMTSGLDDGVTDPYCTVDSCLQCIADAGTRWAYHNAPYTLLDGVIENATGQTLNAYFVSKIRNRIGMNGAYIPVGYNNVYFSNARSMARFGLLMLNRGNWSGNQILSDITYYHAMINTSQQINQSYGYLWWLNGKSSFMVPTLQTVFPGYLFPDAPADVYSALGKDGQILSICPSENLIYIRMGNSNGTGAVPITLPNGIWKRLNDLTCPTTSVNENPEYRLMIFPNPANQYFKIVGLNKETDFTIELCHSLGVPVSNYHNQEQIDVSSVPAGMYYVKICQGGSTYLQKILKY